MNIIDSPASISNWLVCYCLHATCICSLSGNIHVLHESGSQISVHGTAPFNDITLHLTVTCVVSDSSISSTLRHGERVTTQWQFRASHRCSFTCFFLTSKDCLNIHVIMSGQHSSLSYVPEHTLVEDTHTYVTVSRKTDPIAQKSKIELLVPASSPICGEYSSGRSVLIAHSVAKI